MNLLCNTRVNPKLSAWSYLFGNFDFNKTPLAPPETKLIIHNKPSNHGSWDFHGDDVFYIGLSLEHYRFIKTYIPKTHAERLTDTATLIPHVIPIPEASLDDHINATCDQLLKLLTNKKKPIGPFLPESTKDHLITLAKRLHQDSAPPIHITLPPKFTTSKGVVSSSFSSSQHNATSEGDNNITVVTSNTTNSKQSPLSTSTDNPENIITKLQDNVVLHPLKTTLYSKSSPSPPLSFEPKHRKSSRLASKSIKITNPKKFNKFLKSYIQENKCRTTPPKSFRRHKLLTCLPPPRPHSLTIPYAKRQRPIQNTTHPMQLRKFYCTPYHGTNFKSLATQHLQSSYLTPTFTHINHIYNNQGTKMNIDSLLKDAPDIWRPSLSNELGRLTNGI